MEPLAEVPTPHDDKYVVFKRDDVIKISEGYATFSTGSEIDDAVVIRRQDFFAAPALATYAGIVGMATHLTDDPKRRAQFVAIADYFQRQSEIAGDEAWKFPDV